MTTKSHTQPGPKPGPADGQPTDYTNKAGQKPTEQPKDDELKGEPMNQRAGYQHREGTGHEDEIPPR